MLSRGGEMRTNTPGFCLKGHPTTVRSDRRYCPTCEKARTAHYRTDPERLARINANNLRWRLANRDRTNEITRTARRKRIELLQELKSSIGCPCGERRPAALDFHHRDGATKEGNIGMEASRWNMERLLAELKKCDVICANCHRVHHDEELQRKSTRLPVLK